MIYNGVDQNCKPAPEDDFVDAEIVADGRKLIEDIGLQEAYETDLISDDLIVQIMERCRPDEYGKLIERMAEDETERQRGRMLDAQLDEYIERRVDEGY